MDILAIRGPLPKNGYGLMGNLAIPGPLVKPLPRPVQIYADIWIYWLKEDLYRKIATELWVILLYQVHL